MDNRAGGRSENLGRQSMIQSLLKEEVLLLIRPKSARANALPSPLIPKELNIQWLPNEVLLKIFRCKIFGFFFSRSLKTREKYISFTQFVYFFGEVCLLFNLLMTKFTIMSKKNIIVNFIIQKLTSKHTSLKKYTN